MKNKKILVELKVSVKLDYQPQSPSAPFASQTGLDYSVSV